MASGQGLCEQVRVMVQQGFVSDPLKVLSGLGDNGRNPSHQENDLFNMLDDAYGLSDGIYWLPLMLEDEESPTGVLTEIHVPAIPPDMMLHCLHRAGQQQFRISCIGEDGPAGLRKWWDTLSRMPGVSGTPDAETCIPCLLHVDGAQVRMKSNHRHTHALGGYALPNQAGRAYPKSWPTHVRRLVGGGYFCPSHRCSGIGK